MSSLGTDLLRQSDARKPDFEGYGPGDEIYAFDCSECGTTIETPLAQLSDMDSNVPPEELEGLADHFGIGLAGKTRDGGWPVFQLISCGTCKSQYVVLTGVQEPSHSYNVITVQGICEFG